MNIPFTEEDFNRFKTEFKKENPIDYVIRCFMTGDEEEYQIDHIVEKSIKEVAKEYGIPTKIAGQFLRYYKLGYDDGDAGKYCDEIQELLMPFISNKDLYKLDSNLWLNAYQGVRWGDWEKDNPDYTQEEFEAESYDYDSMVRDFNNHQNTEHGT